MCERIYLCYREIAFMTIPSSGAMHQLPRPQSTSNYNSSLSCVLIKQVVGQNIIERGFLSNQFLKNKIMKHFYTGH